MAALCRTCWEPLQRGACPICDTTTDPIELQLKAWIANRYRNGETQ